MENSKGDSIPKSDLEDFIIKLLGEPKKRKGSELVYHCPFGERHSGGEDDNPSFYFNVNKGTYYCHGCGASGGWKKLNEKLEGNMNLIQTQEKRDKIENTEGLTLENYAEEKKLDSEFLRKLGVQNGKWIGQSAVMIPYKDRDGELTATRFRLALNEDSSDGRFRWQKGNEPTLYGQWKMDEWDDHKVVCVEGESDCHTIWQEISDLPAMGVPGKNFLSKLADEWLEYIRNYGEIYLLQEDDAEEEVTDALDSMGNKLDSDLYRLILPTDDVFDLYLEDRESFEERLTEAIEGADRYTRQFNLGERDSLPPTTAAESFLKREKEKGRRWTYLADQGQYYQYRQDRGYWKTVKKVYLKKKIREFLVNNQADWDKKRHKREVFDAVKDSCMADEDTDIFNPAENPNLNLINVKNGMLNWRKGEMLPHNYQYHSLFQLPVEYDPDSEAPRWSNALRQWIPKAEVRKFLQEFVGYSLIPDTSLDKALILHGSGANGKSTFLEVLEELFGEENLSSIPLHRLNGRFELSNIQHKLVNICSDLDPSYLKETGNIKKIIAGELLRGEDKYKPSFDFKPVARLIFSANELPKARDKTKGWYRRIEIIKFPNSFDPEDDNFDPNLSEKLKEELPGIFNWAVEGLKRLKDRERFEIPGSVKENKRSYKESNDSLTAFVNEQVEEAKGESYPTSYLYRKYKGYCEDHGLNIVSQQKFSKRLNDLDFEKDRKTFRVCKEHEQFKCEDPECSGELMKKRKRYFKGIKLKT